MSYRYIEQGYSYPSTKRQAPSHLVEQHPALRKGSAAKRGEHARVQGSEVLGDAVEVWPDWKSGAKGRNPALCSANGLCVLSHPGGWREEHTEGQGELDDGACVLSRGNEGKILWQLG